MSDFVNATATFLVVLSVKGKEKLKPDELEEKVRKLIFEETEWLGEPQSPNGCVVTMKVTDCKIGIGEAAPSSAPPTDGYDDVEVAPGITQTSLLPPSVSESPSVSKPEYDEPTFFVKAVKKGKMIKDCEKIRKILLKNKAGVVVFIQTKSGGVETSDIEDILGKVAMYIDEKGEKQEVIVGGSA